MSESVPVPSATCPHCGSGVAGGRFCSACGAALDLHTTAGRVVSDALGIKRVNLASYGRTAWLAVTRPATLSKRWMAGERIGLVSPIAMMGAVTLVTALLAFVLTRWTGVREAAVSLNIGDMLELAPFLKTRFPQAVMAAALSRDALTDQFKQVGSWFAIFWPSLLILPGWLSLAPWRRIDQRGALIFAFVESVFLLILTGVNSLLTLGAPGLMASGWVAPLFGAAIIAHGGAHVRGLIGGGWGYALTRPVLAALWILPIAYLWVVFILTITLMMWT